MVGLRGAILGLALAIGWGLSLPAAFAYTATGDRQFPAAALLPQFTPGDELDDTLPLGGSGRAGARNL